MNRRQRSRYNLQIQTKSKYDIVKKYIDQYDFMNLLALGAPDDEYSIEVDAICERLSDKFSAKEIAQIVLEVFEYEFSENLIESGYGNALVEMSIKLHDELCGFAYHL